MAMQNYTDPEYFRIIVPQNKFDQVGICTCVKCYASVQYKYLEDHTKWHKLLDKDK